MICDYSASVLVYELMQTRITSLDQECEPKQVVFRTIEACPKISIGSLWRFFSTYYAVVAILMIGLGLYLMVFGG